MPLDPRIEEARSLLTYSTPFWAGGVRKDETGRWQMPAPGAFQGCVKIVDKRKRLVPAIAHPWQLELDERLEAQRTAGKPMRAIILKARKLGFSTWIVLKMLQRVTQLPYQGAIVVAQDTKTAGQIFNMAKIGHAHLPTAADLGLGFNIKPALIGSSFSANGQKYMEFGEPSRKMRSEGVTGESIFEIDTARSPEAGRGYTPSALHLSEVARWEGELATRKMLAVLNALPYELETMCCLESTANGLNHFYRRYMSAKAGAEDPDTGESYFVLFVPWWRDPAASILFETAAQRERFVETIGDTKTYGEVVADEPELIELYALSPEQLAWRRMMIRSQHENNVELFRQENPASDEEAFIGSGRTVFATLLVGRAVKAAMEAPPPVTGTLRAGAVRELKSRSGTIEVPTSVLWVADSLRAADEPELEVWEHPRKGRELVEDEPGTPLPQLPTLQSPPELLAALEDASSEQQKAEADDEPGAYVVTLDVSEGEENTFSVGDFHALQVFDHRTREQVAVHESRMDLHLLARWVFDVGMYFNMAWVAVEVNGPGVAVIDVLMRDYRYPRLFRRKKIDRARNVEEERAGWRTDAPNKAAMEAALARALEAGTHGLRDLKTARQLTTYVAPERGAHRAQDGEHDDRLVGAMIAHRIMELVPPPRARSQRVRHKAADDVTGY